MRTRSLFRRVATTTGAAVVAGLAVSTLLQSPAAADPAVRAPGNNLGGPSTQAVTISLASVNRMLTVHDGSTSAGAVVDVHDRVTASNGLVDAKQLWQFVPDNGNDDIYQGSWGQLRNVKSGLCLNVSGASTADLQPIIQWPCEGRDNEKWRAVETSPGSKQFTLSAKHGPDVNLGVNLAYCRPGNNTPTLTRSTSGHDCSTWKIDRVGGERVMIANNNDRSYLLDSRNPDNSWNVRARTYQRDGDGQSQGWYLQRVGTRPIRVTDGSRITVQTEADVYKVVSVHGNDWANATCLEVPGARPGVGAAVQFYGCDPNAYDQPNQLWVFGRDYSINSYTFSVSALPVSISDDNVVMYNVAMLDAGQTTGTYPVASISSTMNAANGATLTMENQNATVRPRNSQIWRIVKYPTTNPGDGGSGGGGSGSPSCNRYQCLIQP